MANKRMFSRSIVQSDAFLDMPSSTQLLYFQFGMEADDDGFIGNPKKILRTLGFNDDDMKLLITKRFLIFFESGVIVVKHHRMNNNWDKYNNKRTVYLEEFAQLNLKENMAYTLDKSKGIPVQSARSLIAVGRREEKRREENKEIAKAISPLSEVKEVRIDSEGKERPEKKPRDTAAFAMQQRLYDLFEKETDLRPTSNLGDYKQVQKALKGIKPEDIVSMVEDAIQTGTVYTVRGALTDRAIDKFRRENL